MKKSIFIFSLVFLLSIVSYSQVQNPPCFEVSVIGPSDLVDAGETFRFNAKLDKSVSASKFSFEWKISQGEIIAGQGTAELQVATTSEMQGTNLTATVKVVGYRNSCIVESSEFAVIRGRTDCGLPSDSYGKKMSIYDEFLRLDNYFVFLQSTVGTRGHILFEIEKTEKLNVVQQRISKLINHFDFRKFDRNLARFDVCYADQNQTTFRIVPDGAEFPDFSGCQKVDIDLN